MKHKNFVMQMPKEAGPIIEEIVKRANEHSRRIRILEERGRSVEMRIIGLEEGILNLKENMREEFTKINEKLSELERRIMKIENDLEKMNKEFSKMARKTELDEVKHLLSLFNPLTSRFVTREEVKRIIEEKLERI